VVFEYNNLGVNMNKSKKLLITWAIVLNCLTLASCIGTLIWVCVGGIESMYLSLGFAEMDVFVFKTQEIIYNAIDIALNLGAVICLSLNIYFADKRYNLSKKLFIAGLVLNILSNPLSIATILLVVAQFRYMDIEVIKEKREDEQDEEVEIISSEDELRVKIEKLRKLKEQGLITEDEFNSEILKLL
jgi:hypothetical protein